MTDLLDTFEAIERVEFAARLQGAVDVPMFLDFVHASPAVQGLFSARDPEAIVSRITRLMTKRIDPNYMHPEDPAIAAYLDTLYRMQNPRAIQRAWKLCAENDKLYWTHQVAQSINLREQSAAAATVPPQPEIDPEEDTTDIAPEPDPEPLTDTLAVTEDAVERVEARKAFSEEPFVAEREIPAQLAEEHPADAKPILAGEPKPEPVVFPAPPDAIDKGDFARTFYGVYSAATKRVAEQRGQTARPTPAWDDIPADHPVRAIFQATCDDMLARLHAVAYVPFPPEDINQRRAVADAIKQGKLAARVTLTPEK